MELVVFFLPVLIKDVETNFWPHPGDRCAVSKNGEVFKESPNIFIFCNRLFKHGTGLLTEMTHVIEKFNNSYICVIWAVVWREFCFKQYVFCIHNV
ncbi:hypothetical protein BANRA_05500 [Klebsiella pneumoniae]|nr:hypothetical protein BANRA_05500 [Klebsiella pneumoniae]